MKRKVFSLLCMLAVVITASAFSKKFFSVNEKKENVMYNYTWFLDPDYTAPTGTEGTINAELTRLRTTFSSYAFNNVQSMGMHEYEWGYFPNQIPSIIYTNMP